MIRTTSGKIAHGAPLVRLLAVLHVGGGEPESPRRARDRLPRCLCRHLSQFLLVWGMTFAAGAMIDVISHEVMPETHRHAFHDEAAIGITAKLALMMFLNVAFG